MNMDTIIETKNLTKKFGNFTANDHIDLAVKEGEIRAIIGENGAGKSTLMNMLYGILQPTEGEILFRGKKVAIASPRDAIELGIGMVHQHFKLSPSLSIYENIVLGTETVCTHKIGKKTFRGVLIDKKKEKAEIQALVDKFNFNLNITDKVSDISVGAKQRVEILKMLYRDVDLLILDEPTAVLIPQEVDDLIRRLIDLKKAGKTIIIITHKLNEVKMCADNITVIRAGHVIGTVPNDENTTDEDLAEMMVGRAVSLNIDRPDPVDPKPRLKIEGLTCVDNLGVKRLDNVTFTAMSGEILGIAGIAGSGQRELLECITGLYPVEHGTVTFLPEGKPAQQLIGKTPNQIRKAGVAMAFVPEDRLGMGLVGSMGMGSNMMLRSWRKGKGAFVNRRDPNKLAMEVMEELEVVTPSISTPVRRLSGGNVQKVLVGREIAMSPSVLLTAYAVRGLDINTSYTIYNLLTQQKMKGSAVVFVGEDLDVLLELCDRILVLCGGKVSGIVDARTATKEEIGLLMTKV